MDGGIAGRERPARGNGFRRCAPRTAAAQRGNALDGRALLTVEPRCVGASRGRASADRPGSISFRLRVTSEQPGENEPATSDTIEWHGRNRDAEGVAGQLTFA